MTKGSPSQYTSSQVECEMNFANQFSRLHFQGLLQKLPADGSPCDDSVGLKSPLRRE